MRFMGTCGKIGHAKSGPATFRKYAPGPAEARSGLLIGRSANSSLGQVRFEQNPFAPAKVCFTLALELRVGGITRNVSLIW
jgi:hypothetical protein